MDKNKEKMTICFHYEQVFGSVFDRKNDKCCGILKIHRSKAKAKKPVPLDMATILRNKSIEVKPGYKLCSQCIIKYSIIKYSIIKYSIIKYSIIKYSIIKYSIIKYSIIKYSIIKYSIIKYSIIKYSILSTV